MYFTLCWVVLISLVIDLGDVCFILSLPIFESICSYWGIDISLDCSHWDSTIYL